MNVSTAEMIEVIDFARTEYPLYSGKEIHKNFTNTVFMNKLLNALLELHDDWFDRKENAT